MIAGEPRTYYPILDELRGVAIILILLFHNFDFISILSVGWIGVDIFFVLSGYLITKIIIDQKTTSHNFSIFLVRRTLRIFPVYFLFLLVFFHTLPYLSDFVDNNLFYSNNQVWFWVYAQNWLFILKGTDPNLYLNHFWTLAVEEQFYISWPIILYITHSKTKRIVILTLIFLLLIVSRFIFSFYQPFAISYENLFFFTRIDGLVMGSFIAIIGFKKFHSSIKKHIKLLILFVTSLLLVYAELENSNTITNSFLYPLLALSIGIILAHLLTATGSLNTFIKRKNVLYFFGTISYSLYVIHWPIYLVIENLFSSRKKHLTDDLLNSILIAFIAILVSVVLSYFSYIFFEKRILKLKHLFKFQ